VRRVAFLIFVGALAGCGHAGQGNHNLFTMGRFPGNHTGSPDPGHSGSPYYDRKRAEEIQQFVWQLEARQKLKADQKRENSN
jgi:hypothetical protein